MSDEKCVDCGHPVRDHTETLFGFVCEGREWHDDREYQCPCKGANLRKEKDADKGNDGNG